MISENDLWRAVWAAFPYPSNSVQKQIDRIALKCLKKAIGWTRPISLNPSTCDVREVVIGSEDLPRLICYHERTNLTGRSTPIVVVRISGHDIVIEGNNRVNNWVKQRDLTPRLALVIEPRDF